MSRHGSELRNRPKSKHFWIPLPYQTAIQSCIQCFDFRYTEPQRLGEDTPPFQESRTTVEIDCGGRRGRTLDLHLLAADGAELADLPLQPDVAAWRPFDQHSLSTYFLAACIRMGRIRGRLEPS